MEDQDERIEYTEWKREWFEPLTKDECFRFLARVEEWALATRGDTGSVKASEQRYVVDLARRAKGDGGSGWEIMNFLLTGHLELDSIDEQGVAFRMHSGLVRDERSWARDGKTSDRILKAHGSEPPA